MKTKINLKKVEIENVLVTDKYKPTRTKEEYIPIFLESVSAGFPSPADDYLEGRLDLNEYLVRNPSATFFLRVTGDSMIDAGIHSGDVLIVDRSLTPRSGSIVIAAIDGELVVKRLKISKNKIYLIPENRQYEQIEIKSEMNFEVWGVVTSVIHSLT